MAKWFSRKFLVVQECLLVATAAPVIFKHFGVSEQVTMTVLGLITLVVSYYFKVNKDLKAGESNGSDNGHA